LTPGQASVRANLPLAAGGVGHMAVREDGSIRDQSLATDTLTKIGTGA
jgi:hypothetical protein